MADTAGEVATQEKPEKKKKEKSEGGEKKKKSSVKKEKAADSSKEETVPHDSLNLKKEEVVDSQPQYVEAGVGPDVEPSSELTEELVQEAPSEPVAEVPEQEEVQKPRRKVSRRTYELEIDEEKLNMLREAFQIFDFNHDGVIDKEDLKKIQIAMGQEIGEINEDELERMVSEACDPLDFDAFVMLLGYKTIELDPEEVLRDALSRWDTDGTGLISEDRLRHDLMHLGDKFTEKEVDMALEDAPLRFGFGFYKDIRMIDYVKFCHILCGLRKKTRDPSLEEYGLDVSN